MTQRTNARVAGFAFLLYIVFALTAMALHGQATAGEGTAAKLAGIARHEVIARASIVFDLLGCYCALVLAVTLYALTRAVDADLARLVLAFRLGEGVIGAASLQRGVSQIWLATASGPSAPDPAAANALGAMLLKVPSVSSILAASFFGVGSMVFAYLLLRGRLVPAGLAWIGLLGSIVIVVALPLQLAGFLSGPFTDFMWIPLLAFEVPLGFWLIFKGVAAPQPAMAAR